MFVCMCLCAFNHQCYLQPRNNSLAAPLACNYMDKGVDVCVCVCFAGQAKIARESVYVCQSECVSARMSSAVVIALKGPGNLSTKQSSLQLKPVVIAVPV